MNGGTGAGMPIHGMRMVGGAKIREDVVAGGGPKPRRRDEPTKRRDPRGPRLRAGDSAAYVGGAASAGGEIRGTEAAARLESAALRAGVRATGHGRGERRKRTLLCTFAYLDVRDPIRILIRLRAYRQCRNGGVAWRFGSAEKRRRRIDLPAVPRGLVVVVQPRDTARRMGEETGRMRRC
ncbi:hypothetical protein GUJ93_ZPchr0006g46423 [Zizania palustris]|uniref:Uncharacterized protein n=1 Tax=Zizania palustris TaxID=103762 RepID=A0A8J5T2L3_ZIZPA|nr:hypothetical protein GUJ93_ZPchr0006g46423 [Zizania palustris]